jgi:hypothetical protein
MQAPTTSLRPTLSLGPDDARRLWALYHRNPALHHAGWTLAQFFASPQTAIRDALFPPDLEPPEPRRLLPQQLLVAWLQAGRDALAGQLPASTRLDLDERADHAWLSSVRDDLAEHLEDCLDCGLERRLAARPTGRRPMYTSNGREVEPLASHRHERAPAHRPNRRERWHRRLRHILRNAEARTDA